MARLFAIPMLVLLAASGLSCAPNLQEANVDIEKYVNEVRAARRVELVCDEPVHDFGVVWADAELCHTFAIKNVGKVDARIRVFSGGDTTANNDHTIAAGSTFDLEFCLNSRKLNGPFEKAITVVALP